MEISCCPSYCVLYVCVSVQNYLYLTHKHTNTVYLKVKMAALCPPCLWNVIHVCWKSHSNSDNLYEMEIRGEYYHFLLPLCPLHEGYFKRQLVCLWFRRKERGWHKPSLSLNSRCTFPFILGLNEEWWKKQRIKVCFLTICCNTAEAGWRNKFSFENSQ